MQRPSPVRILTIPLVLALTGASVGPAAADSAGSGAIPITVSAQALTELPDSTTLASETLVRGSLGTGFDGNARHAYAVAWPNAESLDRMKPGDSFHTLPVAHSSISSDGTFSLRAQVSSLPRAYVGPNGELDLLVTVWDGASMGQQFVTSQGLKRASAQRDVHAAEVRVPRAGRQVSQPAGSVMRKPWLSCSTTLQSTHTVKTAIGTGMTADTKQASAMTYKNAQSVQLGVAVDISTDSVGFKAGGSTTVSSSFDAEWAKSVKDREYMLEVKEGKYKDVCYIEPDHYYAYTQYVVRPIKLTGGYSDMAATPFTATHCTGKLAEGTWKRNKASGSAYYNSIGLRIKSIVGFDVSSSSNYDSSNSLIYYQPASDKYKLCGSDDYPALASKIRGRFA